MLTQQCLRVLRYLTRQLIGKQKIKLVHSKKYLTEKVYVLNMYSQSKILEHVISLQSTESSLYGSSFTNVLFYIKRHVFGTFGGGGCSTIHNHKQ